MDQEDDGRGLNQTGKSLGASHAVADAAASAEALCRTLDSAKISSMAADLRATAAGPTMLKTKSPEDGRSQRSTSSSALLQEQEEEERRLTALSPEVAEFDLSRLRGTKAPTEEGADKHRKGKKHHNHHHGHGGMGGNDGGAHGHAAEHGQHGQGHHGGDHQFGGGPAYHSGGGSNHHHGGGHKQDDEGDADLANLAELVPGLRSRAGTLEEAAGLEGLNEEGDGGDGGQDDHNDRFGDDERKMPATATGQRSQRREGGGNRWSTQTRRPESPERNTRDGGGGPGSPDASPQQRAGRIDNLDSMNVGVGHSRSAEEGDPHVGGIGDGGSDDDDVAHALAAGAAAGLAGVVEADKAREAEDGDSNSNESLVTRDDAEPMPGEEPGEYDDLSGFGPDEDGDNSSSSSRSSAGNDNGNSSSNNNANTSESVQRSAANNRKGNKVKKHLRKARNKNQNQNQPNQPHDGGPAPKAPEHSSDGAIGGPTYHSHGGGSGHDGGGGRASPHQHQLTEPRLPPAPEPALHEYGAAASASAGTASGRDRAGRPVPLSGQSVASLSTQTATQTHEVRMPMYLPTFKPATGCTNASDFIVRCFVARLRSGITVVKHGRSRWCKSRLRILHVHSDGRSLTWKPALGEPSSSKRPPKLDLSTCQEVRHAWSPDPLNPMFTGTPILRQKCEAANAHKSFALVFPKRTVDITAVTADQCKVLMEGFSALCFRLQVANLAGKGGAGAPGANDKKGSGRTGKSEQSEEDRTTASVTLTNTSRADLSPTARGGQGQGGSAGNAVGTGDRNRASRHYR